MGSKLCRSGLGNLEFIKVNIMVFFSGIVFQFHLWEKRGRKEDAEVILQLNFFFFWFFY